MRNGKGLFFVEVHLSFFKDIMRFLCDWKMDFKSTDLFSIFLDYLYDDVVSYNDARHPVDF